MGIVVAPLHLEVCAVVSSSSSISDRSGSSFLLLLESVETLPPDRMRRRFAPTMAAKGLFEGGAVGLVISRFGGNSWGTTAYKVEVFTIMWLTRLEACEQWLDDDRAT
jgi:hypothetical protein